MAEKAEDAANGDEAREAGEAKSSRLGRLWRAVTCQRRQAGGRAARYLELVLRGRRLPSAERERYGKMAWRSEGCTKAGARIFVFAPRGERGDLDAYIDMTALVAYTVSEMHPAVVTRGERFAVVWAQGSDHRFWPWQLLWLKRSLHERYSENLEAVYVVHPSWAVRILRLALWPIARDEFWDYFQSHERIEFLDASMDLTALKLPGDLYEYDKFLDQEAEEMTKQAANQMGAVSGMGGFGSKAEALKKEMAGADEHLQELQRLMKEKGYGDKKAD